MIYNIITLFFIFTSSVFATEQKQFPEIRERHKTEFERKKSLEQKLNKHLIKDIDKEIIKLNNKNPDTLGTIMGTVTDIYGNPIEGVEFCVDNFINNWSYGGPWETDSLGHYTITGFFDEEPLDFTCCKLQTDEASSMGYIDEWYDNKYNESSADIITVAFPDTIKNIDFELELGGCISGYVTSAEGPLTDVEISIRDAVTRDRISYSYTDSTGYYIAKGLSTGSYKLETWNWETGYVDEWYDNKLSFESATPVSVTVPDTTTNINFELEIGGCISGYVTSAKGPLSDVSIDVCDAITKDKWFGEGGWTDSTGYYIVTALPTGNYKVKTHNDSGYVDLYWNNKLDWNSADVVNVTLPDTVNNINFSLYVGGKIKGSVYSAKGLLKNIGVYAFNINSGEIANEESTDTTGNYIIDGLPTGYYKLWALPDRWGDDEDTVHAFEWYNNRNDWWSADSVYIAVPDSILNVDFALEEGGFITGTVYGTSKPPITGAEVGGWLYISNFYGWYPLFWDEADTAGKYKLRNLRTGNYKVSASAGGYGTLWYNQKDSTNADFVAVTMPNTTPNIDFNLTGVEETENIGLPYLLQAIPNPFVKSTTIKYFLSEKAKVSLNIYNLCGQLVKTLVDKTETIGLHSIVWDKLDDKEQRVSSGIYFYRITTNKYKETKKLILVR